MAEETTTTSTQPGDEVSSQDKDMPRRGIFNDIDMKQFMNSSTKKELLNFVEAMGKSCTTGNARFDPDHPLENLTPSMATLHGALRQMVTWVDDFPARDAELARFGNPAFRQWHSRLQERANAIITVILQARDTDKSLEECSQMGWNAAAGEIETKEDLSIKQVSCYLLDAFGHPVRLDYGTGHESSFIVFLMVLSKVACLGKNPDLPTMRDFTLSILSQYLTVTRRLQTDYRLEPAGSHGVWGLDDYHCLPFYFGACQLQANGVPEELRNPKSITDDALLKSYGESYLYFGCIRYIRQLKKGVPFFESSPMLYDISQTLPNWDKVARGMLRLYQGEVLDKRQVVQHFLFSKYFPGEFAICQLYFDFLHIFVRLRFLIVLLLSLIATWTPSQSERVAPTENFRVTASESNVPIGRAPWAAGRNQQQPPASTSDLAPTRAPWAQSRGQASGDNMPPVTRAPWAK
jgi:serine/threonine-protein phosphatase 2A activator